ncbi:hypothetical protein TRIUR3_19505 [Triticum urartu]|uniref:Ubiquitin-like protease family profile domain-containing protein n=1 Tax=Triticum urartu TaxID=4572 RepID=M7ZYD2_TRIUA|nr:hypothetical protein TRIUR3_19505 [Triticum urartu]
MQQGIYNAAEIHSKFEKINHLDRQDMVMLPVLEFTDPNDQEGGRHYWVFNINLRDHRFEMLDSWRKLDNPDLMHCASTIAGAVRCLWKQHYPKHNISHFQVIDIDVPKQPGK